MCSIKSRMHIILHFSGGPRHCPRTFRGLPWVLARTTVEIGGFSRQIATGHGTSAANTTVVATARSRGSFSGKIRRTNHGNTRKSAETAVAMSTAIRGHCHGNAAIIAEVRGSPRQLPRQFSADVQSKQFPRPSTAIRDHCYGDPPVRADFLGST